MPYDDEYVPAPDPGEAYLPWKPGPLTQESMRESYRTGGGGVPALVSSVSGDPLDMYAQSLGVGGAHYNSWINRIMVERGLSQEEAHNVYVSEYQDTLVGSQRDAGVYPASSFEEFYGRPPRAPSSFAHPGGEGIRYEQPPMGNPLVQLPLERERRGPSIYMDTYAGEEGSDQYRNVELHERGHVYDYRGGEATEAIPHILSRDPWNVSLMRKAFPSLTSSAEMRAAGDDREPEHSEYRSEVFASLSALKAMKTAAGDPVIRAEDIRRIRRPEEEDLESFKLMDNMSLSPHHRKVAEGYMAASYGDDWRESPGLAGKSDHWWTSNAGSRMLQQAVDLRRDSENDLRNAMLRDSGVGLSDQEMADILNQITFVDLPAPETPDTRGLV